jgi:hypothetical protein
LTLPPTMTAALSVTSTAAVLMYVHPYS